MNMESEHNVPDPGWADSPRNKRFIRIALYAVCATLAVLEFFAHRHAYNTIEELPLFYAVYGFVSLVFAVVVAKVLRRLVGRREDYYDRS